MDNYINVQIIIEKSIPPCRKISKFIAKVSNGEPFDNQSLSQMYTI